VCALVLQSLSVICIGSSCPCSKYWAAIAGSLHWQSTGNCTQKTYTSSTPANQHTCVALKRQSFRSHSSPLHMCCRAAASLLPLMRLMI
jgi:hypothetical protein